MPRAVDTSTPNGSVARQVSRLRANTRAPRGPPTRLVSSASSMLPCFSMWSSARPVAAWSPWWWTPPGRARCSRRSGLRAPRRRSRLRGTRRIPAVLAGVHWVDLGADPSLPSASAVVRATKRRRTRARPARRLASSPSGHIEASPAPETPLVCPTRSPTSWTSGAAPCARSRCGTAGSSAMRCGTRAPRRDASRVRGPAAAGGAGTTWRRCSRWSRSPRVPGVESRRCSRRWHQPADRRAGLGDLGRGVRRHRHQADADLGRPRGDPERGPGGGPAPNGWPK